MGLSDFEVFIQERLRIFDENLDLSPGSPIDKEVVQPLLRRLGTDPFTVDAATFIISRLTQEFPDLAATDGDATSDLLVKPGLLLLDPIIREIQRVKNMLSLRDPSILTTDEADALGANFVAERARGNFARGTARVYFAQPQGVRVSAPNFFTSRGGLHFFPTGVQAIKPDEMLLNLEGELYYLDVTVVAEKEGDEYNIGPGELVTIANIPATVRVINKSRFRFGLPAEDAVEFVGRLEQELSERSMVTQRGLVAKLPRAFPEITRLNVVGFNDPEMQRDVLTGGSLGPILAGGADATTLADGEFKTTTRRVGLPTADLYALIGPAGASSGFFLTLFGAWGPGLASAQDLEVVRVINATTLELAEQTMLPGLSGKAWCLRRKGLTLSGIPGGILFPDNPNGSVTVTPDAVHIGGCTDALVRGVGVDTASVVLDAVSDDRPLQQGLSLSIFGTYAVLDDLVLGTDYQEGDSTYLQLVDAKIQQFTLEILEGPNAGAYRVLDVVQAASAAPILTLDPTPAAVVSTARWRLLDEINVDLIEPKETRLADTTGSVIQNSVTFTTAPVTDFDALGVSEGDTLRLHGRDGAVDYTVEAVVPPFFTQLTVDRPFTATRGGVRFEIFRPNADGGAKRPLIRITSVDLLDTSSQPIGSKVPYAKPVESRSRAFQNPGSGEKVSVANGSLGIVSLAGPFLIPGAATVSFSWDGILATITAALTAGAARTATQVAADINVASQAAVGFDIASVLTYNLQDYVVITPGGPNTRTASPSTAHTVLFGDNTVRTSRDIRSATTTWASVTPALQADLDAVWVRDGFQTGFYEDLELGFAQAGLGNSTALRVSHDFSPELARSIVVGSRSLGSARLYFLEPTSMEVDQDTRFAFEDDNGTTLLFKPDPTLRRQILPPLPNGVKATNGESGPGADLTKFQSVGVDFVKKGVREDDILVIDFVPVLGTQDLDDPVLSLALKELRISLDSQPDKVITFVKDVPTAGAVSREGVVSQINSAVGLTICSVVEVSPGDFRLRFNPEMRLVVRAQPTNAASANVTLGFSNTVDTNNVSDNAGEYVISSISGDVLTVSAQPALVEEQQYKILRAGSQRICTTQMDENLAEASLHYWDVELVSEGPGDLWNIDSDQPMTVSGYRSDGYYLSTADAHLSFSIAESLELHLSRSILEVGTDDDPENATQLSGQSLSVSYEYSSLVANVQNFMSSESERVINDSPLSRHLIPHFVRFDLNYIGGAREIDVVPDLERYIREVLPTDRLESSDLQKIVSGRGATSIENPINMLAVVHNFDRTVTLARSQDGLTTGRLAAFIPDVLNVKRRVS